MIIYGVAVETRQCHGHGDFGSELRIVPKGCYGSGEFPPFFYTSKEAEAYMAEMPNSWETKRVVELDLRYPGQPTPTPSHT